MNNNERNSLNTYLSSLSNALRYAEGSSENIQASEIPTRIRGLASATISAPIISFNANNQDKVQWSAVSNAAGYIVYINGSAAMTTIRTEINMYDVVISGQTQYTIRIRAYGSSSGISNLSNSLSWILQENMIGVTGFDQSSGTLTWLGSAAGKTTYTKTTSGNYVSVSSPLDSLWPFNAIEEVTIGTNKFSKLPKAWITWEVDSNNYLVGVKLTPVRYNETSFIPDCFLKPGSTTEYNSYYYMGTYEGSGTGTLASVSGAAPTVNTNRSTFRVYATSNGAGYQLMDFSAYLYFNILTCIYFKSANIQIAFYNGRVLQSSAAVTGSCDGVTGLTGYNTSTTCCKILGVENPYGNIWKWVDGINFNSGAIYITKDPTQFNDNLAVSANTLLDITELTTSGVYISKMKVDLNQQSYMFSSSSDGGGASAYYGDYYYYDASGQRALRVGGGWSHGSLAGPWYFLANDAASKTYSDIGARLCYRDVS